MWPLKGWKIFSILNLLFPVINHNFRYSCQNFGCWLSPMWNQKDSLFALSVYFIFIFFFKLCKICMPVCLDPDCTSIQCCKAGCGEGCEKAVVLPFSHFSAASAVSIFTFFWTWHSQYADLSWELNEGSTTLEIWTLCRGKLCRKYKHPIF